MAPKKPAKKSKTMGKKDLKKTKGGLLPAVKPGFVISDKSLPPFYNIGTQASGPNVSPRDP
ncbi:MAG TPA: hypothetical protein VE981_15820 [Planctomycetota bacterium]|nr:hypothetical protein [Planctomycetota bacterium]